jgi:hypothetical protein
MGCGSSRDAAPRDRIPNARPTGPQPAVQLRAISGPHGGLEMVPTPQRDNRGIPVVHRDFDIDCENILRALGFMAEYLDRHNAEVTIVAVGGAVNTVYLQTRETTHDVDFFGPGNQARLLRDASKYAQAQSRVQLGANWLNNATTLYVGQALLEELFMEATEQNVVLFRHRGLTVYAAPWAYALCGKTNRMSGPREGVRSYDAHDAAAYLHEYIQLHGADHQHFLPSHNNLTSTTAGQR